MQQRQGYIINVMNYYLEGLNKSQDWTSRSQSMVIENYLLYKIWNDINNASLPEGVIGHSPIYVYRKHPGDNNDLINSKEIINFLFEFIEVIMKAKTYSELLSTVIEKGYFFTRLDIRIR